MGAFIDLTGKTYGRLTVIGRDENSSDGRVRWKCRCSCGNESIVLSWGLKSGQTKSCGCFDLEQKRSRYKDIAGQRFGRLIAIEPVKTRHNGGIGWKCKCDCGNEIIASGTMLRSGRKRSCGCLHMEQLANIDRTKISHKKHGGTDKTGKTERLYSVWKGMKSRCYNKNNDAYKYYGARGITVCDEWKLDYGAFRDWAKRNGYNPDADRGLCTIDRVDNNGNYEPSNCRFVSMAVQNENKRARGTALCND